MTGLTNSNTLIIWDADMKRELPRSASPTGKARNTRIKEQTVQSYMTILY